MAFGWVIRHQKKALFVLAAALIVGWGVSGLVSNLMRDRGGRRATDVMARIAGQDVTYGQFNVFRQNWSRVFPDILGREGIERRYAGQHVSPEEVAWAWYGLLAMARRDGTDVPDDWVVEVKRRLYQNWTGRRDARLDESADAWFRKNLGMNGRNLDFIVREFLMAQKVLGHILGGLQATEAESWEQYARENRAVRVRWVEFPASDFLARAPQPDNEKVQAWYNANKGEMRTYYNPPTVQIEYAQLLLSRLAGDVTVTTDEMKDFYEKNKDLYKVKEAVEGKEAEYLPFPEVKPEIEESLKRKGVNERAVKVLDEVRQAFAGAPPAATLEDVLKALQSPAVEYRRSPFLTDVQLLDLPGIGVAHVEGANLAQIAFSFDASRHELSPVLSTAEGRWVFRPAAPVREGSTPDLSEVKDRVIADLRRSEALKLAADAAGAFDNDVVKLGGPTCLDRLAGERKLVVKETPFFLNNLFDANRPDFIERSSPLDLGALYGPWVSEHDGVAAVLRVVQERPAERAGFAGEDRLKRAYVLASKTSEFPMLIMPRTVLKFAGWQDLRPRATSADNATQPADE